jgi:hypothetical protein
MTGKPLSAGSPMLHFPCSLAILLERSPLGHPIIKLDAERSFPTAHFRRFFINTIQEV